MEKYAKLFGIGILCFILSFGLWLYILASGSQNALIPVLSFILIVGFVVFGIWGLVSYLKRKKT